jgi:hypothetical protein
MFLPNKYTRWYFSIINNAKSTRELGYFERHHIIPRCMGGDDKASNIVKLSAKEHFICHHLLTKMVSNHLILTKLWNAFFLMHITSKSNAKRYRLARTYEVAKIKMAAGKKLKVGEKNHFFNKVHSDETKLKMSRNWNREKPRHYIKTIHVFVNIVTGETFTGTRRDHCKKYNLTAREGYKITTRTQKTVKNWRLADE